MGGRKKRTSIKKKGGRARYDPHVNPDVLEDKGPVPRVDRETLKNFLCLREGCGQPGRIDRWCGDACWGCIYCSEACFREDLAEGGHQLLCRYTEGHDNFELRPVPDGRYDHANLEDEEDDYQHKGLYAKRDIARDAVAIKQAPLFFKIRRTSTPAGDFFLKKCFHHADYLDRRDEHPLRYASMNHLPDNGDNIPRGTLVYSVEQTRYIVESLMNGSLARMIKWMLPKSKSNLRYARDDVEGLHTTELYSIIVSAVQKIMGECTIKGCECLTEEINGVYTFELMAYINHSCVPNLKCTIIGDVINFVALRDIQKGEELTIAYEHVETTVNRDARKERIKKTLKFVCACDACRSYDDVLPTGTLESVVSAVREGLFPLRNKDSEGQHYSLHERSALAGVLKDEMVEVMRQKFLKDVGASLADAKDTRLGPAIEYAIMSAGIEEMNAKDYPRHMRRLLPGISSGSSSQKVCGASRAFLKASEGVFLHKSALKIRAKLEIMSSLLFSLNRVDLKYLGSAEHIQEILNIFRTVYYLELTKDNNAKANLLTAYRAIDGQTLYCEPAFRFVDPLLRIYARFAREPGLMYKVDACAKDREIRAQIERINATVKKYSYPGFDAAMFFGRYYDSDTMMFLYFVAQEVLAKRRTNQ